MIDEKIIERLYSRRRFGIKLGLDIVQGMLEELGNPQDSYGIVHVAGTNGKGSVCSMLESVFRASGYKTGLYTSPHLVRLNERFRVDWKEIDEADMAVLIDDVEKCAATVAKAIGREPTFFECTTVMAFEHFRRAGVEMAVIETGLGGRYDATNIVLPLVSVITRISLEHTEQLGDNLVSIAHEKAGIIKRGRPVICSKMSFESMAEIRRVAEEVGAPYRLAEDLINIVVKDAGISGQKLIIDSPSGGYGTVHLPLAGAHQVENLALCAAAVETLQEVGINISVQSFRTGISSVRWPGRFQVIGDNPTVILDGAHNPAAAEVLADTLKKTVGSKGIAMVLGMCQDKDLKEFLKPFLNVVKKVWAVPLSNERSRDPGELAAVCREMGLETETSELGQAMNDAREWALECGGVVCIAGSLFLVGEVLGVINE